MGSPLLTFLSFYPLDNPRVILIDKIIWLSFSKNTNYFANSFFPYCTDKWNSLNPEIKGIKTLSLFKVSCSHQLFFIWSLNTEIALKCFNPFRHKGFSLISIVCISSTFIAFARALINVYGVFSKKFLIKTNSNIRSTSSNLLRFKYFWMQFSLS